MKTLHVCIALIILTGFVSCKKENGIHGPLTAEPESVITVPNGSFEMWDNFYLPENWTTNSCPTCMSPFITDIVQRDTEACYGTYSAKLIYNQLYAAWAQNKFAISVHPDHLSACVKCNLQGTDTVLVKVSLLHNSMVVDSGQWMGTTQIDNFTTINIPITQSTTQVDTAIIFIHGGEGINFPSNNTIFWVDNLILH
jgi:hypothetical protein